MTNLNCSEYSHCCNDVTTCDYNLTAVGANCECNLGFSDPSRADVERAGRTCVDVNECEADLPRCDTVRGLAQCANTNGSFTCTCNPGWAGSGLPGLCQNVDECELDLGINNCHPNAICTDSPGSFSCACPDSGFSGDGVTCCAVPADTSRPLAVSVTFGGELAVLEANSSSASNFKAAVVELLVPASGRCLSASSATVELSAGSIVALVTLDPATVASTTVDATIAVFRGWIDADNYAATNITVLPRVYFASAIRFQPVAPSPPTPPPTRPPAAPPTTRPPVSQPPTTPVPDPQDPTSPATDEDGSSAAGSGVDGDDDTSAVSSTVLVAIIVGAVLIIGMMLGVVYVVRGQKSVDRGGGRGGIMNPSYTMGSAPQNGAPDFGMYATPTSGSFKRGAADQDNFYLQPGVSIEIEQSDA